MSTQQCSPQSLFSVEQLIQLAEQAYDEFSPGIAAKYYENAIVQQPKNALLHHQLGVMYIEHGEPELAHKAFLKSIELSPNENESNYLYIGQQCYGDAAKSAFEKGIELMKQRILSSDTTEDKQTCALKSEISSAYVSIAELFMTDLCDQEDAQTECEKYLQLSLQFDTNNIECYAAMAQFRHCQQKEMDAIKYLNLSLQKLLTTNQEESDSKMDDALDIFGQHSLPMDSLLKIVKLGIELEQYQQSLVLLQGLVNANDGIGEFWALGAFCFYKLDKKKHAAIWLNNAESIVAIESGSTLNLELNETLQAIKSEMNVDELPDLSKLNLDETIDEEDDDDKTNTCNEKDKNIVSFLEDDEDDDIDIDFDRDDNMIEID
eukprot:136166_1